MVFGERIRRYVKSGRKRNLSKLLVEAVKELKSNGDLSTAWEYVRILFISFFFIYIIMHIN